MIEEKILAEEENVIDKEDTSSDIVITTPFSPNDIKLTTPPMNLGDLIDMIKYRWINFTTEYQREDNLWSDKKQSRLIESVLLGLRLPAFYFEEVSKKQWNIIDGLQRCSSIRNYCVDESLTLSDLEFLGETFNDTKFSDLPFEVTRDIRMLPITVNLLSSGVPDRVKYILFKRLNTGGVELTPQEIRNAMFQGIAIETVQQMSRDGAFLKATDKKIPTKRKQDQDFVSRFIAFYLFDYEKYVPDLETYINKSMELLRDSSDSNLISKMKTDFIKAMDIAYEIFGNDAFRKRENVNNPRNPLNKAYFEVISTTFAKLSDQKTTLLLQNRDLLKRNLIELMNNKSYSSSLSGGTGTKDSVLRRFSWFRDIIERTINGNQIFITDDNKIENSEL